MLGSVLICGGNKKGRLEKAWDLLSEHGFKVDAESPDLFFMQKESEKKSIGIAQAKEVKKFLQERPFKGRVKAVVVEGMQLLTDDAQGSLLKILEEPPSFALIILLCDKEGSLLSTVVSRCQKIILREKTLRDKVLPGNKSVGTASTQFNLADKSYEELFDLAKEVSQKDKDEAVEFLERLLRYDISSSWRVRNDETSTIVKLERAVKEIKEANVALKFALEYLFLMHKAL